MLNHACSNFNTITLIMLLPLHQLTLSSRRGRIVSCGLLAIRLGAGGLAFSDDIGQMRFRDGFELEDEDLGKGRQKQTHHLKCMRHT